MTLIDTLLRESPVFSANYKLHTGLVDCITFPTVIYQKSIFDDAYTLLDSNDYRAIATSQNLLLNDQLIANQITSFLRSHRKNDIVFNEEDIAINPMLLEQYNIHVDQYPDLFKNELFLNNYLHGILTDKIRIQTRILKKIPYEFVHNVLENAKLGSNLKSVMRAYAGFGPQYFDKNLRPFIMSRPMSKKFKDLVRSSLFFAHKDMSTYFTKNIDVVKHLFSDTHAVDFLLNHRCHILPDFVDSYLPLLRKNVKNIDLYHMKGYNFCDVIKFFDVTVSKRNLKINSRSRDFKNSNGYVVDNRTPYDAVFEYSQLNNHHKMHLYLLVQEYGLEQLIWVAGDERVDKKVFFEHNHMFVHYDYLQEIYGNLLADLTNVLGENVETWFDAKLQMMSIISPSTKFKLKATFMMNEFNIMLSPDTKIVEEYQLL